MYLTHTLVQSLLFRTRSEGLPLDDRIRLTYQRAQAIGRAYSLTPQDLLTLSPKFWQLHTDPIWTVDGAAGTLVTLQYNCCAGTLAMFAAEQPGLVDILKQVLTFNLSGQFCLTEVGHGIDAIHLETTATLLDNGEFELDTPNERAAKYMPPTTPVGIPCVAIVFARTMVNGEDHGIKPFVVNLHNGQEMMAGIVSKLLPQRGGSHPLNHALTYFHHVRLPHSALLGTVEKPTEPRAAFFFNISRVAIGTIALGSLGVPALQVSSLIAARYSLQRTIIDATGNTKPIISFRTQKTPIMTALAQSFVMQAMHHKVVSIFRDPSVDIQIRQAVAAVLKVVMIQHAQAAQLTLGDRCGAQGLFEVNQLTAMHADIRGAAIAEGDLLAISIRYATELLLGRYEVPTASDPKSLLARHERGLFDELRGALAGMSNHRSQEFDRSILPECVGLIQAIGHRIAYEAAVQSDVDSCLVDLYVISCVRLDPAWYVEVIGLSRLEQREMESRAVDSVFLRLEEFLSKTEVEPYISAPFVSNEKWESYLGTLITFGKDQPLEPRRVTELADIDDTCTPPFIPRLPSSHR